MIELFVMYWLWKTLANHAQDVGRSRAWGLLGPGAWLLCEFLFALVAAAQDVDGPALYGIALVGAVCGGAFAWYVVKNLEDTRPAVDVAAFD